VDLLDLQRMCNDLFGVRGGDGSQEATGAVGHIKGINLAGPISKTLFVARQGGPFGGVTVDTTKYRRGSVTVRYQEWEQRWDNVLLPQPAKARGVVDCRDGVLTMRGRGEWTGYHAEMIIVSRWIGLLFPGLTYLDLTAGNKLTIEQRFQGLAGRFLIAANAPCCKHCDNMLTRLRIVHPVPAVQKHSLTAWWNPLLDKRAANGSTEFGKDIPFD
jgi:hypothetical protein